MRTAPSSLPPSLSSTPSPAPASAPSLGMAAAARTKRQELATPTEPSPSVCSMSARQRSSDDAASSRHMSASTRSWVHRGRVSSPAIVIAGTQAAALSAAVEISMARQIGIARCVVAMSTAGFCCKSRSRPLAEEAAARTTLIGLAGPLRSCRSARRRSSISGDDSDRSYALQV
eukprot:scaffold77814_cov67-Phaeocystis_antarctica.AAC.6